MKGGTAYVVDNNANGPDAYQCDSVGNCALLYQDFESDIAAGLIVIQEETDAVRQEFIRVLEQCYSAASAVFIRTNDALHIASAKAASQTLFVTADLRQRTAAIHVGLSAQP